MVAPPKRIKQGGPPPGRPTSRGPAPTPAQAPVAQPAAPENPNPNLNTKRVPQSPNPLPQRGGITPATNNYNPSFAAVKEMQKAILNFADVAASSDVTAMNGNKNGRQSGPNTIDGFDDVAGKTTVKVPQYQAGHDGDPNFVVKDESGKTVMVDEEQNSTVPQATSKQESLGGSDPFGNFLVNQYVNKSTPVGQQYVNVDVKGQQNRQNAGMENKNLRGMIDSLRRVGSPGKEKEPDGIWMDRTDTALKQIYAIGYAIMNLANDMDEPLSTDVAGALKNFQVPNKYTQIPADKKVQMAKDFTQDINILSQAFADFRAKVLDSKKYAPFINQHKSFFTIPKGTAQKKSQTGEQVLDDKQKQVFKAQNMNPIGQSKLLQNVTLNDLYSLENFKKLMGKLGKNPTETKATIDEISNELSMKSNDTTGPGY